MQAAMVSDVLKSMSAAGPEAWGVPIGVGAFAEILVRLDRQRDGFDGSDVARVEAMWAADVEPDFAWTGGFVVALKDGQRVYVSGDATPIYDLVYWQVGGVLYTVESHNMTGDTTMGIANSLMSLVVPETGGETPGEEPAEGVTTTQTPADGIFVSAIGAPTTVASGEIASIDESKGFGKYS